MPLGTLYLAIDLLLVVGGLLALRAVSRSARPGIAVPAAYLAASAVVASAAFIMSYPLVRFEDFRKAYYGAGAAVLNGPATLAPIIEKGVASFVNLPIVAYLFAPFALLGERPAAAVFTLIGAAAIVAAWALLVKLARLNREGALLLVFLFAASGPLNYSFKEGNTSHIVLLGLAGGLHLLRMGREIAAGALLGLMAIIKLPLILFGAYFLLRRYWHAALGFAVVLAATTLLSLLVFGWYLHVRWLEVCVLAFSREPIGAFNNQSIVSFLLRLTSDASILQHWDPVPVGAGLRFAGTAATGLLFLAAVWACVVSCTAASRDAPVGGSAARDLEYLLVVVLAVISSPLAWTHYYAWMLMPIAFFLSPQSPFRGGERVGSLAWAGILLLAPATLPLSPSSPLLETLYVKLAVSHVLLGGLIWFALIVWSRSRI